MPLSAGDKLSQYQILAPLGAGGMGEVYRAHDTQLERDVAIKVLPRAWANDSERLARFDREAKILAALNHPNIAVIYGLIEAEGQRALAMELVPGETLLDHMKRGPMPLDEILPIARQIAEALEAAHERGVIHRDFKPANVMITPAGLVKVLDFGLAAMTQPGPSASSDPVNSPTLTMGMTQAGIIMGTAAYMAPEQAAGTGVDKRADIWSYGVVLFEMLSGARLFSGDTVAHTLAGVLRAPIEFEKVTAPAPLKNLLRRCLDRNVTTRLRDIGEARIALLNPADAAVPEPVAEIQKESASKLPWLAAGVLGVAFGALAAWAFFARQAPASHAADAVRFTLAPPPDETLTGSRAGGAQLAVSPDGRYVAFVADPAGGQSRVLWVRALGSLAAQKLDKTEGATDPFWSPDSKNIAFFADGKLKRIAISGGSPINICYAEIDEGGAWFQQDGTDGKSDGVILFTPNDRSAIQRVPATGGVPTPVTKLVDGDTTHRYPQFLPDGKHFLYHARGARTGIYLQELGSDRRTFLMSTAGRARFAPPDYLLYLRDSTLLAQHVDWTAGKPLGEPVSVTDEVRGGAGVANARNAFSVSDTGVLAYRASGTVITQFRWYTRDGKPDGPALGGGAENGFIELSPDNKRAVLGRQSGAKAELWLMEFPSGVVSRLTSDGIQADDAVWSPDSRRIAFVKSDASGGNRGIYQMLIGTGKDTLVYPDAENLEAWTRDGLLLRSGNTVSLLPAPEENSTKPIAEKPRVLLDVNYRVRQFDLSPDGKWIAYESDESGEPEVWVAAFPEFTARRKVSGGYGVAPLWRADGKELIFIGGPGTQNLLSVEVKAGAGFDASPPKQLFSLAGALFNNATVHLHAVSSDARRFLIREAPNVSSTEVEPLYLILNWPALLGK